MRFVQLRGTIPLIFRIVLTMYFCNCGGKKMSNRFKFELFDGEGIEAIHQTTTKI
jgi:hypothetical protein